MEIKRVERNGITLAEVVSDGIVINELQDALDLMVNAGAPIIVVRAAHLHSDFFRLSTRFAGEILQKFSTYQVRLAIVGDFSVYDSESLQAFIRESSRNGQVVFVPTIEEAYAKMCGK